MNKNHKLLPVVIMLIAGLLTSIITFIVHYEVKTALLLLFSVLLIFYILGLVLAKVICRFEQANEQAPVEDDLSTYEEGKVVEKDGETA